MYSIGLAMKLRPGCYEEYKDAHDNLWPELAKGMRENEISMAIYRSGDTLFIHAVAPSEQAWNNGRNDPVLDKWHEYMVKLLEANDKGEIDFTQLEPAFEFGMFKG